MKLNVPDLAETRKADWVSGSSASMLSPIIMYPRPPAQNTVIVPPPSSCTPLPRPALLSTPHPHPTPRPPHIHTQTQTHSYTHTHTLYGCNLTDLTTHTAQFERKRYTESKAITPIRFITLVQRNRNENINGNIKNWWGGGWGYQRVTEDIYGNAAEK